jgi:hypothetical protein
MSSTTTRDHLNPDDPLYYAPPRLSRGADFPSPPAPQTGSDQLRTAASPSRFDELLEEAVAKSLRLSPEAETASEPGFTFEHDQRRSLVSVAARFAAAVAASAVVAFFFVVMVPTSQRSDLSKVAGTENQAIVASAPTAQSNVTPEETQALLLKFVQWQQRDGTEQQLTAEAGRALRLFAGTR